MTLVTLADVRAAAERIAGTTVRTPIVRWPNSPLWIKPESLQPIGSFKLRGAYNTLARLPEEDRARGVVAYSSGNHAQAVAYAAKVFGVKATIVIPDNAPALKVAATESHGATVVRVPMAQRESKAHELVAESGAVLVPPFDHPDVIAGQGTIGLEIAEDLPDVELVLTPVSGAGLISGVAVAIKALCPNARVVGVEPELAADAQAGLRAGEQVSWPVRDRARTVADGLRSEPSDLTFAHLTALVDDIVTVSEDEIRAAVASIADRIHLIAEPSGAVPVAAYLNREELRGGRTVAVLSGGNIDPAILRECLG